MLFINIKYFVLNFFKKTQISFELPLLKQGRLQHEQQGRLSST